MKQKNVRMCLMTFNIICFFVGVVMLVGGLLLQFVSTVRQVLQSLSSTISSTTFGVLSVIMIAIGALICLISFVGCCGIMSESKCMIGLYCIFLLLLLIGQGAIAVLGLYYGNTVQNSFERRFKELMTSRDAGEVEIVDDVQKFLKCCGYKGPDDYLHGSQLLIVTTVPVTGVINETTATLENNVTAITPHSTYANTTAVIFTAQSTIVAEDNNTRADVSTSSPTTQLWRQSCCIRDGPDDDQTYKNITLCMDSSMPKSSQDQVLYTQGCEDAIIKFIKSYAIIIGAVSAGFVLLEIIAFISGCFLYKSLD